MVKAGVVATLEDCTGDWCRLAASGYEGWVAQPMLWGAYPGEQVGQITLVLSRFQPDDDVDPADFHAMRRLGQALDVRLSEAMSNRRPSRST